MNNKDWKWKIEHSTLVFWSFCNIHVEKKKKKKKNNIPPCLKVLSLVFITKTTEAAYAEKNYVATRPAKRFQKKSAIKTQHMAAFKAFTARCTYG